MKKHGFKKCAAAAASVALAAVLAGCGAQPAPGGGSVAADAAGAILLSINPEIELEYDAAGNVTEVEAKNDDGREVVADTKKYEGRPVAEVASELVADIHAHGFFDNKVDGHDKNILLKLEPGSGVPDGGFLQGIEAAVEQSASGFGLGSNAITVAGDMLDEQGLIGLDAAKDIAMAQLGIPTATFADHDYELDDGVYELKFFADGVEYEYEVDGLTGKVLEADIENNDDWDDKDSWDDMVEDECDLDDDLDDADDADDADDNADDATDDANDPDDADDDPDGVTDDADDDTDDTDDIDDPDDDVEDDD